MILPLAAFLLIAAGWTAYWFHTSSHAQARLATFETETLALNCAEREWGGFPFRISFDCRSPRIEAGGVTITAANLRLIMQAWNANHIIGAIIGPTTINNVSVTGDTIRFSHRMSGAKLALASLIAENQTVTTPDGQVVTAARLEAYSRPAADKPEAYQVAAIASNMALDDLRLDNFKLDGTLTLQSIRDGNIELLTEPSDYLDAIWFATRLAKLSDKDTEGVEVFLVPLLKQNNNKLPLQRKDATWYWGPFQLTNR
jgi:hypothetical protein